MLGINVVAAETDEEARQLFTSHQQAFVNLRRGHRGPSAAAGSRISSRGWRRTERWEIDQTLSASLQSVRSAVYRQGAGGVHRPDAAPTS